MSFIHQLHVQLNILLDSIFKQFLKIVCLMTVGTLCIFVCIGVTGCFFCVYSSDFIEPGDCSFLLCVRKDLGDRRLMVLLNNSSLIEVCI